MNSTTFIKMMQCLGFSETKDLGFSSFSYNESILIEVENYNKTTFDISGFKVTFFLESKPFSKWINGDFKDLAKFVISKISEHITTEEACKKYNIKIDKPHCINDLKNISPVVICRKTGNEKAIAQGHATRTKKRILSKVLTAFELVDKLGFKISIEPKN